MKVDRPVILHNIEAFGMGVGVTEAAIKRAEGGDANGARLVSDDLSSHGIQGGKDTVLVMRTMRATGTG